MPLSRAKVLIVDDDITTIRLIAEALTPDYDVIVATDAQDGLAQVADAQPDLVLLDVVMPQINGFAFCRKIKSDEKTQKIPVIFVTALSEVSEQTRGFELGAVDYITKPIEVAVLRARVKSHTRLYRQTLELESLAATDALTGLANRRKFDDTLRHEIERCQRNHVPLSLLMIDIDDFKAYNDFYGHGRGDDCLIQVARILKEKNHRSTDFVCRLGGEEFGVVLAETNADGAKTVASNILEGFANANLEHKKASSHSYLTVSIGICNVDFSQCYHDELNGRELVDCVDEALYDAKEKGRNRSEFRSFVLSRSPGEQHSCGG